MVLTLDVSEIASPVEGALIPDRSVYILLSRGQKRQGPGSSAVVAGTFSGSRLMTAVVWNCLHLSGVPLLS